jgi:hypothetical protein
MCYPELVATVGDWYSFVTFQGMDMETKPKAPTPDDVQIRIKEFDDDNSDYDRVVGAIFGLWPLNSNPNEVLAKVVILNHFYNLHIRNVLPVVDRIVELKIDDRLPKGEPTAGDPTLVDELAQVKFKGKIWHLFSFATKYCAWHQPKKFQIFDRYVDKMLWSYRGYIGKFRREDLYNYEKFAEVIDKFRACFKLEAFSRRDLDKFLWLEGKDREQKSLGLSYAGSDEPVSSATALQSSANFDRT